MDNREIVKQAKLALARQDLFFYCHLKSPDFYKEDREYLVDLCSELQDFDESEDDVLVINEPPRHGKSRTAQNYVEWSLGRNKKLKIMTGSYNETVATQFSKGVRNSIQEIKGEEDKIVYSYIFPGTVIKQGDGAANLWSLDDGYANYLATSPTGTATGFGADRLLIDDLIKSALEANNIDVLNKHWEWFTNTMLSRLERGGKIIIIMTRWHSMDLAGRALSELPKLGYKVRHVSMKAMQDDGSMLCDDVLSKEEYLRKTKTMGLDIASANYQQEPIDIKGRLYSKFKTYDKLPKDKNGNLLFRRIIAYGDTADEGKDYFALFVAGETFEQEAYLLDVIYTKEPMEITEPLTARILYENGVNTAIIESNNGGRGFSRAVKKELKKYPGNKVSIKWFHQSKNKIARILSNSTWVMDNIYFPYNWKDKWPDVYEALSKYQKEGKNEHDDAPDALTGIAESIGKGDTFSF
ncbi:phage terminase large subunit [Acetoanaerobium noterae]|uniref:phage terminase large subunit n=1 Tax=Acetoanaerobium noterae TaxID=745369 RepID=UPI00333EF32F